MLKNNQYSRYKISPPQSETELLYRARSLAGLTVGELASSLRLQQIISNDLPGGKGRIGSLLERALGATAGNQSQPDFVKLGIELKTIPINALGRVRESSFVCYLNFYQVGREDWIHSQVRKKLRQVLWVPIESSSTAPLLKRHIGMAKLWQPTSAQEEILRMDWEHLVGRIAIGKVEEISGHLGRVLQIRPKARTSQARVKVYGPEGEELAIVPCGFYLRARFIEEILWS